MQAPGHEPHLVLVGWVQFDPDAPPNPAIAGLLSPTDAERAARFRYRADRARFILGRRVLRHLLEQAGVPRAAGPLDLALTEHRRPYLSGEPWLAFSIAHAGGLVAVALARDVQVGLDLESLDRQIDFGPLAGRIFSPSDLRRFHRLPVAERARAFFRAWTGKEAVLKARGVGLFGGLQEISVPFDEPTAPCILSHPAGGPWHISPLDLKPGYLGCVACSAAHTLRVEEIHDAGLV